MFKAHFSSSSTVFTKNIKIFFYFMSINNEEAMTNRKIIKTVYKVKSNKISKMNEITNRVLRQFVNITTE